MKCKTNSLKSQQGVVLVVSLIMLALLTVVGTNAMQATGLEEKMAGNMRDRDLAFQAAESALAEGEAAFLAMPYNCTNGRYPVKDFNCDATKDPTEIWDQVNWMATANKKYAEATADLQKVATKPKYMIESMGLIGTKYQYRITTRGTGGSDNSVVILQSVIESSSPPPS